MRLNFRDTAGQTKPAPRRRTRDDSALGTLGNNTPGNPDAFNQATTASMTPAGIWLNEGQTVEPLFTLPAPHIRDSRGGAYLTKVGFDGALHVAFAHGAEWNAAGSESSGIKMTTAKPTTTMRGGQEVPGTNDDLVGAITGGIEGIGKVAEGASNAYESARSMRNPQGRDAAPYDGRGRPNPRDVVENYVGSRVTPAPAPAGTQDGHALGSHANPTLVRMNQRNQKARTSDAWASETTTVEKNSTLAAMNEKARKAWAGRS